MTIGKKLDQAMQDITPQEPQEVAELVSRLVYWTTAACMLGGKMEAERFTRLERKLLTVVKDFAQAEMAAFTESARAEATAWPT